MSICMVKEKVVFLKKNTCVYEIDCGIVKGIKEREIEGVPVMKKLLSLLLFTNDCYTSDQESLGKRRRLALELLKLSNASFQDPQESQFGKTGLPCPARRSRSREVDQLSRKIFTCEMEEEFKSLCREVLNFCETYHDYMNRIDFVETDGPARTGCEVINDSLIYVLQERARYKKWTTEFIPELNDRGMKNSQMLGEDDGQELLSDRVCRLPKIKTLHRSMSSAEIDTLPCKRVDSDDSE